MSEPKPISWTDPALIDGIRVTIPPLQRTATGYGRKLPSRFMVHYAGRWHRVYAMCFGNVATHYICQGGADLVLDNESEWKIERSVRYGYSAGGRESDPPNERTQAMAADNINVNTYNLKPGDKLVVIDDRGTERVMEVAWVDSPGSTGRAASAGPRIGAHIRPGGYSISFDYTTPASILTVRRLTAEDCEAFIADGTCIHSEHTK